MDLDFELGQYPAILTSRLVNNIYLYTVNSLTQAHKIAILVSFVIFRFSDPINKTVNDSLLNGVCSTDRDTYQHHKGYELL